MRVSIPLKYRTVTRGTVYRYQTEVSEPEWHPYQLLIHCTVHRYPISFKRVEGTYSEKHTCDARCVNAIGPNCECSCGGENHGGGYAI